MPHSHLPELGSGGQRLTTKKMDGTVTDITQMKLIGVCVFFFKSHSPKLELSVPINCL